MALLGRKPKIPAGTCCGCRRPAGLDGDYTKYNVLPHDAFTGNCNGLLDMFPGVKTAFVHHRLDCLRAGTKLVAGGARQRDKGNVAAYSHVGGKTIAYDMEHVSGCFLLKTAGTTIMGHPTENLKTRDFLGEYGRNKKTVLVRPHAGGLLALLSAKDPTVQGITSRNGIHAARSVMDKAVRAGDASDARTRKLVAAAMYTVLAV